VSTWSPSPALLAIWAWIDGGSAIMELEGESWPGPEHGFRTGGNWYRWDVPAAYTLQKSMWLDSSDGDPGCWDEPMR
jgi:hypothetical protein